LGDYTGIPFQQSLEVKILIITDFFRQPRITGSFHIEWVYSLSLCKFLKTLGGENATLPQILAILLQRLAEMPAASSEENRQVILACQAFATSTIFASPNLQHLRVGLWNPLNFYHPSELDYGDFLQMSLLLVSEPHKKLANRPLNLFQGFDLNRCTEWHTAIDVFQAGKHPLQVWLKKKHKLCLIDRIREQGAPDFLRTNYGLLKRTSAIKLGEALHRVGTPHITALLILHRALCDAVLRKEFHTAAPRSTDYQRLHVLYQLYLVNKNETVCSLAQTIERLELLGNCLRNYNHGRILSLNEIITENGGELLDRLSSDRNKDPLITMIDRERQTEAAKLKTHIHQQIMSLRVQQVEMLCLNALGYNDSQIARIHQVSASTIKRRRVQLFQKTFGVETHNTELSSIEAAHLEVIHDYFITEIISISHETIGQGMNDSLSMNEIVRAVNIKFKINLRLNERLKCSLEKLFVAEGVA
jgi:DNA-binding CsgD family transcriptional regulator